MFFMRTSTEIKKVFEAHGCKVQVETLGHSYRAGGEIFIYSPEVDPTKSDGFTFTKADFSGFDGTGYDNRGRYYTVWLVTPGPFVPASDAEFYNAREDKRIKFGTENRSCSNTRFFVHKDELAIRGLADFSTAFAKLGL